MTASGAGWQPDRAELERIRAESAEVAKLTPVFTFGELSRRCGGRVLIKAENLQRTGSFKLRGVLAKLRLAGAAAKPGVVAGSAGNHGQALAYAARYHGVPCTVFMPRRAPLSKVDAVAAFGAEIIQACESVDECVDLAREAAAERGLLLVHPFDDIDLIKGQAGLGLEVLEQVGDLSKIIVPVGGGGLISGVAAAIKDRRPEVEIVGVQAAGCASFAGSLAKGEPSTVPHPSTIADGIAVKRPGNFTFQCARRWVDDFVSVDDAVIAEAMVLVLERAKLVVEGAGAAGVAALLAGATSVASSGTTVAVLSGGNVDSHLLAAVVNRHQTEIGRRVRLFTRISDRPGALAEFLQAVASAGGNVLDITHVRDGVSLSIEETGIEVLVECRSRAHRAKLIAQLREADYAIDELQ